VAWAIEAASGARTLDLTIVTSDDERVLAVAREYESVMALRRPRELATDTAPAIGYVRHALRSLERGRRLFGIIVIVPPTCPLTLPSDVDGTVELLQTSGADSAVSVVKLDHAIHPAKLKRMIGDRLVPYLEDECGRMAADELPTLYVRNCAVYATRREVVDSGKIIGSDCRGYVMPRERSIDINDPIDFDFADFLMSRERARR